MLKKASITMLAAVFLALGISSAASAKVIYVDDDATGTYDGASWADAYKFLQDALADANSSEKPAEIRVAQGVYQPDRSAAEPNGTRDREATFQLISGVALKGGYAGFGQPDPNIRDIALYETILSGDLNGNDLDVNEPRWFFNEPTRRENSFHVVTASGADETAVLDGLSITGGHAYWAESQDQESGGGMYNEESSVTVTNCTFKMNGAELGGGMCNIRSQPSVSNCTFTTNYVWAGDGGGMYNEESSPMVAGCTFSNNSSWDGGGMCNRTSGTVILTNCVFSRNHALYYGGGIDTDGSESLEIALTIKESIIEGNLASLGGGIRCGRGLVTIENSVIRRNRASRAPIGHAGEGGGIFCGYSSITIKASVISRNRAETEGGGILTRDSELLLVNNIITGNEALDYRYGPGIGGGIHSQGSVVTVMNNTIVGNRARNYIGSGEPAGGEAGGIRWWGGTKFVMANCLVGDNRPDQVRVFEDPTVEISYCNIQGGWAGVGNIDADPCFADAGYWDPNGTPEDANDDFWVDGEYHLKSQGGRWDPNEGQWVIDDVTSPCIDGGDPMSPIGLEPFPNGGRINMGAYGGTAEASKSYFGKPLCETIVAGDVNGDCVVDFRDFFFIALHWLEER